MINESQSENVLVLSRHLFLLEQQVSPSSSPDEDLLKPKHFNIDFPL